MSIETPNSDSDLMDLLRIAGPLSVLQLADAMEVTATAVRQRLTRLTSKALIQREAVRAGRGRPKHRYWLTEKGVMSTGSNFTDLALALWSEFSQVQDDELRRQMLRRIARTLAQGYAEKIQGTTATERIRSLGELLAQRRIPVSVEDSGRAVHADGPCLSVSQPGRERPQRVRHGEDAVFRAARRRGGVDAVPPGRGG